MIEAPAFRDYISRLARHHTVIRYDQPGRGASEPDGGPPTGLAHETAIVRGLFDELGLDRADLLGASSGGGVAAAGRGKRAWAGPVRGRGVEMRRGLS